MTDLVLSNRRAVPMTFGTATATNLTDVKKDMFDLGDYYQRTIAAGYDAQALNDNILSASDARKQAFQERIDAIKAATGEAIDNPLDRSVAEKAIYNQDFDWYGTFYRQLDTLAKKYPDKANIIQAGVPIDQRAFDLANQSNAKSNALTSDPNRPAGTGLADFIGRTAGYLKDPVNVSLLFVGGPEGKIAQVTGSKLAGVVIGNAIGNAAGQAIMEPAVQAWHKETGQDYGWKNAAENIGFAGLIGGGFAGGLHLGGKAISAIFGKGKGTTAAERIFSGAPESGDLKTAGDAAGLHIPPEDNHIFETGMSIAKDEKASFHGAPDGLQPAEIGRIAKDAVDHINGEAGPVSGAVIKAERLPDVNQVVDEAMPTPASGRVMVQNKPVQFEQVSPATVQTDAAAYQYKGGGDASGVTDRLKNVQAWDATASGKVFIHEHANGQRFIADGHQRLGLARRLQAAGDQSAVLDAYVFKEKDGWSVADVRALAAKKNMQEGSGTAIDAARILRDRPDLLDNSLPVSGPMMRKATALSRLSPDAWGMTLNGFVSESHAALVGEMVADPGLHSSMLKDLAKFDPKTDREARLVIGEALNAGRHAEVQNDMFGSFQMERTLMGERVKVLDGALKALNDDKKLFATLANNADIIESAGNQLDTAGNKGRAVNAEMIGELLQMMARSRGPVSDALTAAAKQMAEGMAASKAAKGFIGEVRGMLEKDGLGKLLSPPEPVLKPATVIEPGSAESAAIGENASTAAELEAEGQFNMFGNAATERNSWDLLPDGIDVDGNSKLTTASDLFARADRTELLAEITKSCKG